MKAWLSRSSGPAHALTLEKIERPKPGSHQLLIAVRAIGVNFYDSLIIVDRYQARPARPFSPGGELAGIVVDAGDGKHGFRTGDHVVAFSVWGAMAEYVAVDADRCIGIPPDLAFDKAAALLVTYGTAVYALEHRGRVVPRETVLILGAAGGVGLAAIDIAKAAGTRVVAAVSAQDKAQLTLERGADASIIYPTGPLDALAQRRLADEFKEACGGSVDVVCDCVGGDYALPALRSLGWHGRYLIIGFAAGIAQVPWTLPLVRGCELIGVFWGEWMRLDVQGFRAAARRLVDLLTRGAINPYISLTVPFANAPDAIAALTNRANRGKIVVTL